VHSKLDTALGDIIDAVTEECPVVIVFEDCQWIDPGSAAVLERLLPKLGNHQLLVLFTTRSLEGNQIAEVLGRVSRIPLPPLTSSAASEIVLAIARQRGKEVSADYLAWCTAVAEGNPFFLHELANHWVETGDEHGAPASLTAVLKRRLARLSPHALQLLQTCSVLENCSTLDTMESVLGYPPHELLRSLNELSNAGMVAMTKSDGHSLTSDRVNSRHDLLSDTALAQLGTPARAYLHRRAASVLESRISKQGDASTLWSCAKHWQLAGDYPQAFRLTHSCATHLLEAELPSEAAEAFKKAIEYCATDSDRFTTLEGQAIASYQSSDWLHVMEIVPQARRLKDRLFPEQGHHDDLELMLRRAEWQTMNWEHILSDSLDCLDAEEAAPRHRIEAGVMGLMLLTLRGDGETGSAVFSRMISLAARSADIGDDLILQAEMIFNTWWGSVRNAVRAATKLVAAQREQHNLGALLRSLCNAGITLRVAGKFGAAADHLHEALVLADKHRIHRSKAQAIPMLAHMAIEQGKIADARKWLHELKQLPMTDEDRIVTADICAIDTRLALLDGRYAVARHLVEHELGHMRTDPLPHKRAYWNALRVAADLANDGRASTEALVKLHAEHLQTRGHPFQAFAAFALYTGLVSVGDKLRAERLLNEYLTKHRRERWKAPQHLLDSLTSLITKDRRHLRPRRLVTQ
jgi:tetratricopeptide (TPR) repeat protein